MRRTAPMLLAVFAPSIAHATTFTSIDSADLAVDLAAAQDGDTILLTNGVTFQLDAGYVVDEDVTLRPVTLAGAKPIIQAKDATGTGNHSLFIGTASTTAKVTLIEIKLNNKENDDSRSELFIEDGSEVIGTSLEFQAYTQGSSSAIDVQPGSKLSLTDSTFAAMVSSGNGAAIRAATNTTVSLTRVTATSGGSSTSNGGFLRADTGAKLSILDSDFKSWVAEDGGVVYATGPASVTVADSTFVSNKSGTTNDDGGALWLNNTTTPASITNSTFTGNKSFIDGNGDGGDGGAIYASNADLDIVGSSFGTNDVEDHGGAIYATNASLVSVDSTTFTSNHGDDDGGAIYATGASIVLATATDFTTNTSGGDGGAIYGRNNADIDIGAGVFTGNKGSNGGAVGIYDAYVSFTGGTSFSTNAATGDGGAVYTRSAADSNITEQNYSVLIEGATFSANTATGDGGGVAAQGWGDVTLRDCDFTSNKATGTGGAVWFRPDDDSFNAGAWLVDGGVFTGNDGGAAGGAVHMNGTDSATESVSIVDATFASNVADFGGGLWLDYSSKIAVRRDAFCDNHADNGDGGAAYIGPNLATGTGALRELTNNMFVENRSKTKGGGVFLGDKDASVVNNLFLTNTIDVVVEGGGLRADQDGSVVQSNLFLGTTKGDGLRITSATNTEQYNGFAANTAVNLNKGGTAATPTAPSFVFTSAPTFFSYVAGTPADKAGCVAADYRWYVSPGLSPAATTKDTGVPTQPAYSDLDGSINDIGPYGGPNAAPAWWVDADQDGTPWVYDCNDADKTVFPGATELCNGIDDDCDKTKDEGAVASPWYADVDSDGYGDTATAITTCTPAPGLVSKGGDCNDLAATINPGAVEKCSTVDVDDDCNGQKDEATAVDAGTWYADTDVDGYGNALAGAKSCIQPANTTALAKATDCDDSVFATNPGASETCNSIDDDCDKQIDEGATDAKSWYPDADKDSQGDATAAATKACTVPSGFAASNTDCNDKIGTTYLGAPELCNKVDDDCDGVADDGLATSSWYVDGDLDSYGTGAATIDCAAPAAGWTKQPGDCNDASATINPSVSDNTCNGVDDNCDTKIDDGAVFQSWFEDKDADKYGTSVTKSACAQPAGYAGATGDCNDALSTVHPGAVETCNLVDDDCDGSVDNNVVTYTFYEDKDGDGFGGAATKIDCKAPAGYVIAGGDCNDASKAISPGAAELCNDSVDQNCDGDDNKDAIDAKAWYADTDKDGQGDPNAIVMSCDPVADRVATGKDCNDKDSSILDGLNWYGDSDGDTYGNVNDRAYQCAAPSGYLADATDCNDANKAIHPNNAERCSTTGIDDDCDKLVDDQDPQGVADGTTFYVDADNDTYGDQDALTTTNGTRSACLRPPGYSVNSLDCDDTTPLNRPGAAEQCDGVDNNCNITIDENVSFMPYWADGDGDGFGDATAATVIDCVAPAGYTDNDTDCDDTRTGVNPNAPEQCATLGIDDDCDGQFDESDAIDQTAYYLDEDGDDWAIIADEILACEQPPNHSNQLGDCDDLDIAVNPQATEICDGIDNDCDGRSDEGLGAQTVYADLDGDGFGDDATAAVVCRPPGVDESDVGGDCNDDDDTINPGAAEVWYDGVDQDCLGNDDDDQDGDGVPLGDGPADDCDDLDASSYPGALDVPGDGIDQDCDGADDHEPLVERPFDTDLIDTGVLGVPGEACGCATPTSPAWSLAALVAAFAGWRRARRDGTQR